MKITPLSKSTGLAIQLKLANASNDEIREILKLLTTHLTIYINDQNATPGDFNRVCSEFGFYHNAVTRCTHPAYPHMWKITNQLIDNQPGVYSEGELKWHHDGQFSPDPENVVALYANIVPEGSMTSNANGHLAYLKLPDDIKEIVNATKVVIRSSSSDTILKEKIHPSKLPNDVEDAKRTLMRTRENLFNEYVADLGSVSVIRDLVVTHDYSNIKGLFFPVYFIKSLINPNLTENELMELFFYLKTHCFQEEFIYHHIWNKNDILLLDQKMCCHARNNVLGERELFRIPFWYNF